MKQVPKRFSVALAFPRDGGEALVLGVSTKQSDLLSLLDQVDPAEIAVAGVCKDIQFTTRKTYVDPRAAQKSEQGQETEEQKRQRQQKLEGFTDEELKELVAPEYGVDPEGKTRDELIAAIKEAAGYKKKDEKPDDKKPDGK